MPPMFPGGHPAVGCRPASVGPVVGMLFALACGGSMVGPQLRVAGGFHRE
jgi:hypothetical protein